MSICDLIDHYNLHDWLYCPHLYTSCILRWFFGLKIWRIVTCFEDKEPSEHSTESTRTYFHFLNTCCERKLLRICSALLIIYDFSGETRSGRTMKANIVYNFCSERLPRICRQKLSIVYKIFWVFNILSNGTHPIPPACCGLEATSSWSVPTVA